MISENRNDIMANRSIIELVVKIVGNDIVEGVGEVGKDGRATGCEISVDCLGIDDCGKLFNIDIFTSSDTYEEALKIVEALSCGTMHYIKGVFLLDSDEKYDIITVYNPSYEPVSVDKMEFYSKLLNVYNPKKGEYIYRKVAEQLNRMVII